MSPSPATVHTPHAAHVVTANTGHNGHPPWRSGTTWPVAPVTASPTQCAWYSAPAEVVKPKAALKSTGQHHNPRKVGIENSMSAQDDAGAATPPCFIIRRSASAGLTDNGTFKRGRPGAGSILTSGAAGASAAGLTVTIPQRAQRSRADLPDFCCR
eukprot:COSAG01_NODE_342_length_18601_cov_43.546319_19_plen_156_part_00